MKLNTQDIRDFYMTDYVDAASYSNLRQIASVMDGLKNASRKIVWWTFENNVKTPIKVSQYDAKVGEAMQSLHGSMAGVIVSITQNYIGASNKSWLEPDGNHGTRLIPEASAARYIGSYGSQTLFSVLDKADSAILKHQLFEGSAIEPVHLVPSLPMLLVNGATGISSGFAQKILPRNPKEIQKYIEYYLKKPSAPTKPFKNKPYFEGFKGTIDQGETPNQWIIKGNFIRKANKIHITELPIGYSLKQYKKILDKLEDDKKIITYDDFSDGNFDFVVQFNRKYLDALSDNNVIELLKLSKKVSENYTVMSEENRVLSLDRVDEIMQRYIKVKKVYLQKRKDYLISSITQDIRILVSKYVFIKSIIDETLVITKRPTEDIIKDLDNINKIIKVDDRLRLSHEYVNKIVNRREKVKTHRADKE